MSDLIKHTDLSTEAAVDKPLMTKGRSRWDLLWRYVLHVGTWMLTSWFTWGILEVDGFRAGLMGLMVTVATQLPKATAKLIKAVKSLGSKG